MSSLRSLGSITASMLSRGVVRRYPFVRMDLGSGTVRYTTCPGGFVGNIDGTGSKTWANERAMVVSEMAQGAAEKGEDVNSIAFGNADGFFTAQVHAGGVRDAAVLIYVAWFDTDWSLVDVYELAPAYVDAIDAQLTATLALKSILVNHSREVPTGRYYYSAFPTAPHEGEVFKYYGVSSKSTPISAVTGLSSSTGQDQKFDWQPDPPTRATAKITPVTDPAPATGVHR